MEIQDRLFHKIWTIYRVAKDYCSENHITHIYQIILKLEIVNYIPILIFIIQCNSQSVNSKLPTNLVYFAVGCCRASLMHNVSFVLSVSVLNVTQ